VEDAAQGFKSGPAHQNLFAIVQGGLDVSAGGLRERCLRAFAERNAQIPGYAIGGLAGGESKDAFWRVVDKCCRGLPEDKPRYLMGVGYPLDIVVCSALGVDMYDCVYPTRTARFGTAFSPSGLVKLKHKMHALDFGPIYEGCPCRLCQIGPSGAPNMSKSSIYWQLRSDADSVASAVTHHNIVYMLTLVRQMRDAIISGTYPDFVRAFLQRQIVDNGQGVPRWVIDALSAAGIDLPACMPRRERDDDHRGDDDNEPTDS
jgi:queuine tRNA-ribosyltransferase